MCNNDCKNSAHYTLQTVIITFVYEAAATVFTCGKNIVVFVCLTTVSIVTITNYFCQF